MTYLLTNPKRAMNILTTLRQMLEDRKYVLTAPTPAIRQILETDPKKAQEYYDTEDTLMKAQKGNQAIHVMNPKEEKLAIDTVRKYVDQVAATPHTHLLIVIQHITPAAKQIVQSCKQFELFFEKDLYRNITQHCFYAPHRALTDVEEAAILKKYKCEKTNFPILLKSDPVARYFHWKVGTMVQTETRVGGASAPYITYRVVLDN